MMPQVVNVKDAQAAIEYILKSGESKAWINTAHCLTIMPKGKAFCIHWSGGR